ncbi:MAG: PilT/PilU family type 4a pilus ATPase [Myxococcota bacterium]
MAAVDSLLKIMTVRSADLLVLASGEVPTLRRAGESSKMSMPALNHDLVATFAEEVMGESWSDDSSGDRSLESVYRTDDGHAFAVVLQRKGEGVNMTFRVQGSAPAAPAAPPGRVASGPEPDERISPSTAFGAPPGPAFDMAAPAPAPAAPSAPRVDEPAPVIPLVAAPVAVADPPEHLPPALLALLEQAEYERASDVILSAGQTPRMRISGRFRAASGFEFSASDIRALVRAVATAREVQVLERTGSVDLAIEPRPGLRCRVNVFRQADGLAAAIRPIRAEIPDLAQLGLPEHLRDLVGYPHGLVLVCGPTGAGKSTTLVALVEHINQTRAGHVVTLEDPIEYRYTSQRALIHQREIGAHVSDFATGLRAALRESPDVILLGEMRDRETIAAALTAAETGHLVLSTLHSSSASVAIDRIIDSFPEHQQRQVRMQLSIVLRATLTQFLLPSNRPPGRVPAFEKMIVNSAVAHMIRDGKVHQIYSAITTGRAEGMIPLERSLAELIRTRRVSKAAAEQIAGDRDALAQMLRGV